jgi:molybdopterin converting factor small subunit
VAGAGRIDLDVDEWSSPSSVFREIAGRAPALSAMRDNLRCAIDQEYGSWDDRLHDGAELAFIPPTSGG